MERLAQGNIYSTARTVMWSLMVVLTCWFMCSFSFVICSYFVIVLLMGNNILDVAWSLLPTLTFSAYVR